jgi:hypothetical protein
MVGRYAHGFSLSTRHGWNAGSWYVKRANVPFALVIGQKRDPLVKPFLTWRSIVSLECLDGGGCFDGVGSKCGRVEVNPINNNRLSRPTRKER